jgi:NAD(P)-dependent dehydrogenase (short-subunit alcohol dehydrogenase family)
LLSQLGAWLALVGRDQEQLAATVSELTGEGHVAEAFDLNELAQIPRLIMSIAAKIGPLSGVVHCAGLHSHRPLRVLDAGKLEEIQRINVTASVMLAKGFRQKGCCAANGNIVLLSSVSALVGQPGIAAYAASKAAVVGLTRSLAMELAPDSIRVNCVAPAIVKTEMTEKFFHSLSPEQVASIEAAHPLGFGAPRDVSHAIAFLLSDAARRITGSVLVVDGGYTAR